jgi:hypothetical protein
VSRQMLAGAVRPFVCSFVLYFPSFPHLQSSVLSRFVMVLMSNLRLITRKTAWTWSLSPLQALPLIPPTKFRSSSNHPLILKKNLPLRNKCTNGVLCYTRRSRLSHLIEIFYCWTMSSILYLCYLLHDSPTYVHYVLFLSSPQLSFPQTSYISLSCIWEGNQFKHKPCTKTRQTGNKLARQATNFFAFWEKMKKKKTIWDNSNSEEEARER